MSKENGGCCLFGLVKLVAVIALGFVGLIFTIAVVVPGRRAGPAPQAPPPVPPPRLREVVQVAPPKRLADPVVTRAPAAANPSPPLPETVEDVAPKQPFRPLPPPVRRPKTSSEAGKIVTLNRPGGAGHAIVAGELSDLEDVITWQKQGRMGNYSQYREDGRVFNGMNGSQARTVDVRPGFRQVEILKGWLNAGKTGWVQEEFVEPAARRRRRRP